MISNWTGFFGLLLNNRRAAANAPSTNNITNLDFHEITAAQFAVDGKVKQRSVAQSPILVKVKPDGPDVA
jgi:hypothetical protein